MRLNNSINFKFNIIMHDIPTVSKYKFLLISFYTNKIKYNTEHDIVNIYKIKFEI